MKRKAPSSPYRRRTKRRGYAKRKPISKRAGHLSLKRTSFSSTWVFGTASTNDFWRYYVFTAADINNFAEFAAVFDEYRVNAIKVTFRPAYDSVNAPNAAGAIAQPQSYAHVLVDQQSTVAPTGLYTSANLNTYLEQARIRTLTLNKPVSVYFKPKVSDQIFGGGTASRLISSPWVKTTETGVQYRGFHMFLQQNSFSTGNSNIRLDTFYTFYLQFRNVK